MSQADPQHVQHGCSIPNILIVGLTVVVYAFGLQYGYRLYGIKGLLIAIFAGIPLAPLAGIFATGIVIFLTVFILAIFNPRKFIAMVRQPAPTHPKAPGLAEENPEP